MTEPTSGAAAPLTPALLTPTVPEPPRPVADTQATAVHRRVLP